MVELNYKSAEGFLRKNGVVGAKIEKIAGDASFRSYYRVFCDEKYFDDSDNFILMFAPPKFEDVIPFIKVDEYLVAKGFKAPKIYAKDLENGFLLLEDFGDVSFNKAIKNNPEKEEEFYKMAIDCLISLQQKDVDIEIKNYNHQIYYREVELFIDWYLLKIKNVELNLDEKEKFKKLWFEAFDKINFDEKTIILRDYHADNLMLVDGENSIEKVGLLDFQDALIGQAAYDLVSLLEDARRDVSDDLRQKMLIYYIKNVKIDERLFLQDYEILSLQRNIKILGIFARLAYRDNKKNYLDYVPRVEKYVLQRLDNLNEDLSELAFFMKKFIKN